ncbi:unnamed protein product [Orchesella dallaii]|uniref:Cytidyltransferase-like domain-containing protein n=1 Tax=Orchesella dallaii TaxID=48710 RepID=A0ABP1Q1B3_9HEXA
MSKQRVFLLSTGCFNPPTHMHLRMMELARDYLVKVGFNVIGGALSPVHDSYGQRKPDLVRALSNHRVKMAQLSVSSSDWIKVSSWEAEKNSAWTRTRAVCDHHQSQLDKYAAGNPDPDASEWLPDSLAPVDKDVDPLPIRLKLVCGADYLESFNKPGVWENEDVRLPDSCVYHKHCYIVNCFKTKNWFYSVKALRLARDFGLVVITREGNDPSWSINNNDILNANKGNIHVVEEWIRNEISSTKIRRSLRRNESVRYIIPDPVIAYIQKEKLYINETV